MGRVIQKFNALKKDLDHASTDAVSQGKIIIQIGSATCEKAAGADLVRTEFERLLAATRSEDVIIKQTGCTGRCAQEPIVGVFVPGQMPVKYRKVDPDAVHQIFREHILDKKPVASLMLDKTSEVMYKHFVTLCTSKKCSNAKGESWYDYFILKLAENKVPHDDVYVTKGSCIGLCDDEEEVEEHGVMMVHPENVIYRYFNSSQLEEIIKIHFVKKEIAEKFIVHGDQMTEDYFKFYGDVSFFNKQTRITLRNCGIIDPESLTDYIHAQGFEALAKVLDSKGKAKIIEEISASGLRGRGGGGFPVGTKWKNTRDLVDDPVKYVICNADEGDPGAFMDRSALEGDPFSVVEGMIIGAYAMGASKGYLYIRAEYPLAIERVENAIYKARTMGLLGENILGSGFNFDLEIRLGAGAFVCGEETALIHSIEGKRGQPRMRPPYPSASGLWGHPTCINNVETWANIAPIILHGSKWFSRIGTEGSKGTKVFALAGNVLNTGLVEVPMGTTLREIIYDIGGGIPGGKSLKAIQTGGPSGGCIPADKIDTPVDYESLKAVGSMMGSGGMIILDETDCIVQTTKFFLEFTKDESCGKCLPCREGTVRMLEILEKITSGTGTHEDIIKLERLGKMIKATSLCGLGQSAPNPVLSALEYFKEEFMIHIDEKRCPTQKCSQLIQYKIDADKCTGCTVCARRCPVSCIIGARKRPHEIIQNDCIKCGECYNVCKFDAITKN